MLTYRKGIFSTLFNYLLWCKNQYLLYINIYYAKVVEVFLYSALIISAETDKENETQKNEIEPNNNAYGIYAFKHISFEATNEKRYLLTSNIFRQNGHSNIIGTRDFCFWTLTENIFKIF